MSNSDPGSASSPETRRSSSTSSPGSSPPHSVRATVQKVPSRSTATSSPSRRLSNLGGLQQQVPSSPLSSASSAKHRRRQSSFSSNVSTTTDATSYDESGEECMSQDGHGEKEASGMPGSSSPSPTDSSGSSIKRGFGPTSQDFVPTGVTSNNPFILSGSSPHAISIPPSSSLPISVSTSLPPASVRLSTTPLFPSPLAQASGPDEDHDQHRGDDGDAESGDDDTALIDGEGNWPGAAPTGAAASRDASAPFGDLELSPPASTIPLPDTNSLSLEPSLTPRPINAPRRRNSPTSPLEGDPSRTARAPRVRSLGRASGLSQAISAADDAAASANRRRSRGDMSALAGLGVDTSRATLSGSMGGGPSSGVYSMNSTPTRSSTLSSNSISSMSASPPSPSAATNLSVSPSTVSRRASINLASPPRYFQPGSPTGAARNTPRTSMSFTNPLPIPIPAPFPAAPPPSESIKLQRVPESVRSALEFRQGSLSSSYTGPDSFAGLGSMASRTFHAGSPVDLKLPKTPTATRAPSPASGSGNSSPSEGRSALTSQSHSREGSRRASRQSSREKLSAFGGSPSSVNTPSTPATSAFSPLFPFQASSPGMTRSRSKSMSGGGPPKSLRQDLFRSALPSDEPISPRSAAQQGLGVSPSFMPLESPRGSTLHPRTASDSYSSSVPKGNHRTSASISGMTGPPSRLSNHRLSIAATGSNDGTDEYAQIILSTRNAKVRKWRPASPAAEPGGSGIRSWSLAGGRNNSTLGEQTEDGGDDEAETEPWTGAPPKEIEWVDWLDEYRKMKEAKLRADGVVKPSESDVVKGKEKEKKEESGKEVEVTKKEGSPTRSEMSDRRSESSRMAEPALAAAQKGKAKATTTEFNPFEATTASMNRRDLEPRPFLTPGVSYSSPFFPLTASSSSTSPVFFHPATTATPLSPGDQSSYDFSSLKPSTSNSNSGGSHVGSPGMKRKRNFAKLGNKIDAWWSAVRTSFAGAEDERGPRHRRTSIDQPGNLIMPASSLIGPTTSRTSSQYVRPMSPDTPGLRSVASAQDLLPRVTTSTSPAFGPTLVPMGALAPAARSESAGRLRPPSSDRGRTISSGSEQESDTGTTKSWRNPNLSLKLGPSFSTMVQQPTQPQQAYLPRKISPYSDSSESPTANEIFGLSPPAADVPAPGPRSAPEHISHGVPIPQAGTVESPAFSPSEVPMWDRTPALVPTAAHFPVRQRQVTMPNKLPSALTSKEQEKEKKVVERQGFSMHTVRSQIRQRLASAKESCDNELRRIIEGISTFVEKDLQQDIGTPVPAIGFDEGRFGELVQDDLAGGYTSSPDVESEGEAIAENDQDRTAEEVVYTDSDGGSGTRRPPSRLKPSHLSTTSDSSGGKRRSVDSRARSGSPRRTSLVPRHRHLTSVPREESTSKSKTSSNNSSRSNSRSRSPMPPGLRRSSGQRSPAAGFLLSANSKLAEGAFIVILQEIITVATEILDTPISKLTARPGSCAEYIGKVQQIGEAWNENPGLPCRGWYVQLLLAVAGLSRVVEWWEAEKGFWSFDEGDNEDAEPILFISKGGNAEDSPEIRARADTLSIPALSPTSGLQPPRWSPLGIDLGLPDETADARSTRSRDPTSAIVPEDTKNRAEELKQAVEAITSQTLLMELSLDGQLFQYLSSAWQDLVGVDPDECLDTPISDFLFPDDAAVFAEATRQLEADDSHTVEVSFRLRVASSSQASQDDEEDEDAPEDLYEAMEGKGMLMLDGLSGSASHTMWVIRPAPFSETAVQAHQSLARFGLDTFHRRSSSDPGVFLAPGARINLEPILCRICERPTPAWFFEKHNETCNEVHRLEGDIGECNDRLKDLLRTLGELVIATDHTQDDEEAPEYRGIPLDLSPLASPTASQHEEGSPDTTSKPRERSQHRIFDHVRDIVETALSISNPSVTDESGDIPIQDQRLLSPRSESNLAAILHWQRPRVDDAALVRLLSDTEECIRFKLNSVNRLRNTILYAEKVRQEWESKASEAIYAAQEKERAEQNATIPFDSPQLQPLPPTDDSPRGMDHLELPRPAQTLRRSSSQNQGLLSPMVLPEDANSQLSASPNAQLALSPRLPSAVPSSRTRASSIKDFKILKPISKGAFGSVYLAKKITTGDYYAIKVLKKSDMVAKNQVTNVKAERMILMTTAESNFVVKLYYTFQSKDYLYLVMEYLNGGDCGALVKNLGGLTEEWAKKYVAEVVVGLEHLHSSGIIHRDLKPDNLLIDAKGHLKLTDFGLSRIGLLGRQTQIPGLRDLGHTRRPSASTRTSSHNKDFSTSSSPLATPGLGNAAQTSYFGNVPLTDSFSLDTPSESSQSGSLHVTSRGNTLSPTWTSGNRPVAAAGPPGAGAETSKAHFVGTPDYLAPESILGIGMDACVDWWALGVICYEFIYGFPPFHDETPEKVFENILSRRFEWHEEDIDISADARDFIDRLLCTDARRRLGARGAEEVKAHPFLEGVDWDNLLKGPVEFVPNVEDPENTDYFDARGAQAQNFNDEEPDPSVAEDPAVRQAQGPTPATTPGVGREPRDRSETAPNPHDDFGTFSFRNLTVLKQANDDMIRKMKDEQLLPPLNNPLSIPSKGHSRSRNNSADIRDPVSPSSRSASSGSSQPFKHNDSGSSSPLVRPSPDSSLSERSRPRHPIVGFHPRTSHHVRRNSMPSRLRKSSITNSAEEKEELKDEVNNAALTENWAAHSRRISNNGGGFGSALSSPDRDPRSLPPLRVPSPQTPEARSAPIGSLPTEFSNRLPPPSHPGTIDCLVAGRNPIVTKVLETMLQRLGCRVVVVPNGAEAILAAGGIPFDVLFLDLKMAVVDGEKAARMIKSTVNPSAQAPIVAVCSHPAAIDDAAGTLFTATLSKPIMKADLLNVLSYLGFKLETKGDVLRRGSGDSALTSPFDDGDAGRRGSA